MPPKVSTSQASSPRSSSPGTPMKRQMNTSGVALTSYPGMYEDYNRGMNLYVLSEPGSHPEDKRILHTTAAMSMTGKKVIDMYLLRERREQSIVKRANPRRYISNLSNSTLAKQKQMGAVWEDFGHKQLTRTDLFQLMNVVINEALHRHRDRKGLRRKFVWKEFATDNLDYSLKYFFEDVRKNVDWGVKYYSVFRHCDVFMSEQDVNRQTPLLEKVKRELEQEIHDREMERRKTPHGELVEPMTATPETKARLLVINSLPVLGWRPTSQKMNRNQSPAVRTYEEFVDRESRPQTKESVRSLMFDQFPQLPLMGTQRQPNVVGGGLTTGHGSARLESRPGTVEGVLPKVGSISNGMVVTQRAEGITKEMSGPTGAAMGSRPGTSRSHLMNKSIPGSLTGTTDGLRPGTTPAGRPLTCDAKAGSLEKLEGADFPLSRPSTAVIGTTKKVATKAVTEDFKETSHGKNKPCDWFVVDTLFKFIIRRACHGSRHFQKVWGEFFVEGNCRDAELDAEGYVDPRMKSAFDCMKNPIPREVVKQHLPGCEFGMKCNCPNYLIPEGPTSYERAEGSFDLRLAVAMVAGVTGNYEIYSLVDPAEYVKRDALFGREMSTEERGLLACAAALGGNAKLFKLAKPVFLQYHDKVKLSICAALGQAYEIWEMLDAPMMIDYIDQVKVVTAAKIGGHMDLYRSALSQCFLTENDAKMLGEIEYGAGSWLMNVRNPPRPGILLGKK